MIKFVKHHQVYGKRGSCDLRHHFDGAFIITTPDFSDRHEKCIEHCNKLTLDFLFHYGVYGKHIPQIELNKYPQMLPGEIGCALAHYTCWERCLKMGLKSVLILEDDFSIISNMPNDIIDRVMRSVPIDWTIIHFHVSKPHTLANPQLRGRVPVNRDLLKGNNECYGTVAYALSDRGIRYLVETFAHTKFPSDGMTNWLTGFWDLARWRKYGTGFVVIPQVFSISGPSKIDRSAKHA